MTTHISAPRAACEQNSLHSSRLSEFLQMRVPSQYWMILDCEYDKLTPQHEHYILDVIQIFSPVIKRGHDQFRCYLKIKTRQRNGREGSREAMQDGMELCAHDF